MSIVFPMTSSFLCAKPKTLAFDKAAQYPAGLPRQPCVSFDTDDSSRSARIAKNDSRFPCWLDPWRSAAPIAAPGASILASVAHSRTAAPPPHSQNIEIAQRTTHPDKLPPLHAPHVLPPVPPRKKHHAINIR